jgi:antibiotic biosynthesis monooxygenase (ABM) superfamily enzyme
MVPTLGMWSSLAIVLAFSVLVVILDEYVVKPWRHKKWERKAASGDKEAQELLRMARSAKVDDE